MTDYGASKLDSKRLQELIREYRQTLHELELSKKQEFPIPLGWTLEQEEAFLDEQITQIDRQKAHIKSKLEAVTKTALSRLKVASTVTITENRYGRIRAMGVCPSCKANIDLVESVNQTEKGIELKCVKCGASKEAVTVSG